MVLPTAPTQDEFLTLCLETLARGCKMHRKASESSYRCSVCSKSFSSYQALGGHKSSHRRPPPAEQITRVLPCPSSSGRPWSGGGGSHRCNVCYRDFATGQALGGHKRCHYWDNSSNFSGASGNSGGVRDFDLNLVPAEFDPAEDGEEVQSPYPTKKLRLFL